MMGTYPRGELETQQWRGGYRKITNPDTQTYKTREETKQNKTKINKLKVRMNDVLWQTYFWHKISMTERIQEFFLFFFPLERFI